MATDKKRGLLTEQLLTDAASSKKELPSSENVTEEEIQELIEELDSGENIENLEAVVFKKLENGNYTDSIIDEYRQKLNEAKNSDIPTSDKEKMYKDIHRKFLENNKKLLNYIKNSPKRMVGEYVKPETDSNGSINNKESQKKQRVSGRNAFELRSDLIEMAMNLLFHNNKNNKISPEEVVETARTLYIFVENK